MAPTRLFNVRVYNKMYSIKSFISTLVVLTTLLSTSSISAADEFNKNYISANLVFPTPREYVEFDFGLGAGINIGRSTPFGIFEIELFDSIEPAKSSLLGKLKVGISYRDYRIERPDIDTSETDFGLSYGAGIWWKLSENGYLTLEYTAVDDLLETAHIGFLVMY